ncbi:MAG: fimbrillin family protein, partial [Dysgonamonadaceae bacterium]|nr:fimbrillin family protein [Dysgonamonadaceae bacterium]
DDGLSLEISLEQDAPVLRDAAPQPLPDGTTYRLLAVEVSTNQLLALADGVIGSTSPELHVPIDADCKFYALSYKTTETILPAYTVGNTLTTPLAVGSTKDFLLWRSGTIGALTQDVTLEVTFSQQLARVQLIIDSQLTGKTIETINNNITIGEVATGGTFNYPTGEVAASGTLSSPAFSWTTPTSTQESSVRLVFPKVSGVLTLTLPLYAIRLQGVTPYYPPVPTQIAFTTALECGHSYTVQIKMRKRSNKFASSNIYWDGSKLTFKPYSATPSAEYGSTGTTEQNAQYYQGVYFQFGSLVGSSPVMAFSNDTTSIYVPYYNSGVNSTWVKSKATKTDDVTGNSASPHVAFTWSGTAGNQEDNTNFWPRITDSYPGYESNTFVVDPARNTAAMWNSFRGDICQYISATQEGLEGYRMPFMTEFGISQVENYNASGYTRGYKRYGTFSSDGVIPNQNDGKYLILKGTLFSPSSSDTDAIFFPASGRRHYYSPNINYLYEVGFRGCYWSATAGSTEGEGRYTAFNSSSVGPGNNSRRTWGYVVRCVLQEE